MNVKSQDYYNTSFGSINFTDYTNRMDQFEIEHFNRATLMNVGCRVRIKNLVSNAHLSAVTFTNSGVELAFSTFSKGKPARCMTYGINREHLTDAQFSGLAFVGQ
jgi:hypothetical protein